MVPVGRIKARDTVARYIFSDQPQTNRQIEPAGKETTWQLRIKRLREDRLIIKWLSHSCTSSMMMRWCAAQCLLESASIKACTYASATEYLDVWPLPSEGSIVTDLRMPQISGLDLLRRLALAT